MQTFKSAGWVDKGESLIITDVEPDFYRVVYKVTTTGKFKTAYIRKQDVVLSSFDYAAASTPKHFLYKHEYIRGSYQVYGYWNRSLAAEIGSISKENVTILEKGNGWEYIEYYVENGRLRKRGYIFR
jgi:hypothetical protein